VELERLLDALLHAKPGGIAIREWSLYASEAHRTMLGVKDRQAGNPHTPLSISHSGGARYLLVWDDGRISRGFLERRQLAGDPLGALEDALSAAYDDPDAAQVLGPSEIPDVPLHGARAAKSAGGDTALLAERLRAIRERAAASGFRTWSGSFSAGEGEDRLITSAGFDVSGRGSSAGWHVTINGEIGDGFSAREIEPAREFEARLDRLAQTAVELERPAATMPAGVHRVILHPRVVGGYALDTLLGNLDGATVAHGEGHFRREQFGSEKPVLREDLGLRLDPLLPLRNGSYRFTREGLPAARCAYIERGRLLRPILDLKYARRLGLRPTPVPYSADTLFLEGPEPLSLAGALERAAGGALVLSVLGVHTQDTASGDFSLSAPQVLRIGTGEFAGRLKATISGNLFDLLRSDGLDLVHFEGEHTPGLLIDCRLDPK
jgi:PmbA protein